MGSFPAKTPKTENSNLHGLELYRPSSKGTCTKLLFQVIKTIINQYGHSRANTQGQSGQPAAVANTAHYLVQVCQDSGPTRERQKRAWLADAPTANRRTERAHARNNRSVITVPVTSQVPTGNQGRTSRDATSTQGPTIKGSAAVPVTGQGPTGQGEQGNQGLTRRDVMSIQGPTSCQGLTSKDTTSFQFPVIWAQTSTTTDSPILV